MLDLFFEKQQAAHCGVHALNNLFGEAKYTTQQAQAAARFAEQYSPLDEHYNAAGYYSVLVLELMLGARNFNFHGLHGDEDDLFAAPDRPDQVVLGLVVHHGNHYTSYRQIDSDIVFFDSLEDVPRVITEDQLNWAVSRPNVSIFQVTVHCNFEPVLHPVFQEYDRMLQVEVVDRPVALVMYANFCETNRISVSK